MAPLSSARTALTPGRARLASRARNEAGFTLIELLVAIAILGILITIGITALNDLRDGAPAPEPEPVRDAPPAEVSGSVVALVLGLLFGLPLTVGAIIGLVVLTKKTKAVRASAGSLTLRWDTLYSKFDSVRLEWGGLAADPLAILEHSRLLDVAFPKTAAFMDSFSRLQDRITALQASKKKLSEAEVSSLEALTAEVARTWEAAKVGAARASYAWLPEREQGYAATAVRLLKLAADESASVSERATAAEKAAVLLKKIEAVTFPTPMLTELEAGTYLALEARA